VTALGPGVREVLERGVFCHVATRSSGAPHVTPMVFALAGDRLWVSTSRTSVKARTWRRDDRVAGLVRDGERAVSFDGVAVRHDALDPATWLRSALEGPLVALASARFARKNARFFAGYAVDASRVPLAWSPPGRVLVELRLERTARFEGASPPDRWGEWPDPAPSGTRFRARTSARGPLASLPEDLAAAVGTSGQGVLAVAGRDGPVVLPARWTEAGGSLFAVVAPEAFALAGATTASPPATLVIERPSAWRARRMLGAMLRGRADAFDVARLASGVTRARAIAVAAGGDPDASVVVALHPERIVWWRGWDSGTVDVA
jgi:hypothetical protein